MNEMIDGINSKTKKMCNSIIYYIILYLAVTVIDTVGTCSGKFKVHNARVVPSPATKSPTPPTTAPTVTPSISASPTSQYYLCPFYKVSNTNSARLNGVVCQFIGCPGTTLEISSCTERGSCRGDQLIHLYGSSISSDHLLASNDDSCGTTGKCASISYTPPSDESSACQVYNLYQGCFENIYCSGQFEILGGFSIPTDTEQPTSDSSLTSITTGITSSPSISNRPTRSTLVPTSMSASRFRCDAYSATETAFGTRNGVVCQFRGCPNETLSINNYLCFSTLHGSCVNANRLVIRLYGSDMSLPELASSDDSCDRTGKCASISYTPPLDSTSTCQVYNLYQGCYDNDNCNGQFIVTRDIAASSKSSYRPSSISESLIT